MSWSSIEMACCIVEQGHAWRASILRFTKELAASRRLDAIRLALSPLTLLDRALSFALTSSSTTKGAPSAVNHDLDAEQSRRSTLLVELDAALPTMRRLPISAWSWEAQHRRDLSWSSIATTCRRQLVRSRRRLPARIGAALSSFTFDDEATMVILSTKRALNGAPRSEVGELAAIRLDLALLLIVASKCQVRARCAA